MDECDVFVSFQAAAIGSGRYTHPHNPGSTLTICRSRGLILSTNGRSMDVEPDRLSSRISVDTHHQRICRRTPARVPCAMRAYAHHCRCVRSMSGTNGDSGWREQTWSWRSGR